MPDGSNPEPRPASTAAPVTATGIVKDPVDIRDRAYEPTLSRLARSLDPDPALIAALRDGRAPWRLPRNQGNEGTCGGQALAALIDIERIRSGETGTLREDDEPDMVSARMLYQCARLRQDCIAEGVSLREVIKAFYNFGACRDRFWPYEAGGEPGSITIESAKDARNISLGAYYRLRPNLNTYHAALHEAGALLVSAALHDGWKHDAIRTAGGRIVPPAPGDYGGDLVNETHAFVIVGYTPSGFLVLNSWGPDWGGWTPAEGEPPVPGIALWRYEDWADRILDGWVLRLGVGAADAFDYSIGDQGMGFGVDTAARSTPVSAILGNFLHLDDGHFVETGGYVSTRRTLDETLRLLKLDAEKDAPDYDGVLLTFAGGILGMREAAEHVARWKRPVRDRRWYPFTVLWCVDYVEQARAVLDGVFREVEARTGGPGPSFDTLVEERAHGVGRALWRDIICAAERAARTGGPLHDLVRAGADLAAKRPDFRLRIVGEGEGGFAVAALIRALWQNAAFSSEKTPLFDRLDSIDLIAPPLTMSEFHGLAYNANLGWGRDRPDRAIRLHVPVATDEARLRVPPYGRSYFDLVRRAFQSRDEEAALREAAEREKARRKAARSEGARPEDTEPTVQPAPVRRDGISAAWTDWERAPRTALFPIRWPDSTRIDARAASRPLTQIDLIYRSDVGGRLAGILTPPPRRAGPAQS